MSARLTIENALRAALINEEFRLAFQPIVSLSDSTTIGEGRPHQWNGSRH